jgi:hypothetical protein
MERIEISVLPSLSFTASRLHLQNLYQKAPFIRDFFNDFRGRFACAVPGFGFDPNQNRVASGLRFLHRCGEFEAVRRDDAIIVIGSCN